ncbi:MAG: lchAD, partial [Bacilli bacterium]|nr:lchAD [Bacilli bacterium]
ITPLTLLHVERFEADTPKPTGSQVANITSNLTSSIRGFLQEKEFLSFFLPAFRADFKALETFEHTDRTLLQSPVHIFNGDQDEKCSKEAFGWTKWAHRVRFHQFQGGHMFLLSETGEVANTIQLILTSSMHDEQNQI